MKTINLKSKFGAFFLKLFSSYILFLFVPIIIFALFFQFYIFSFIEEQVSQSNIGKLSVVQRGMEVKIESLVREALKIAVSESLNDLNSITMDNYNENVQNMYIVKSVYNTLSTLPTIHEGVHSVYLYNSDYDYVISSLGEVEHMDNFEDNGWIEEYEKDGGMALLKTRNLTGKDIKSGKNPTDMIITLIYPISSLSANMNGAIAINIYQNSFHMYLDKSDYSEDELTQIINQNGDIIVNSTKENLGRNIAGEEYVDEILSSSQNNSYFTLKIDGRHYVISYLKSEVNDWIYINKLPMNSLYEGILQIKLFIIFISVILVFVGIFLSYMIAGQIYKPVKGIMETLCKKSIIDKGWKNEISVLSTVVNNFITDEEMLKEEILQHQDNLKKTCLYKLINGEGVIDNEVDTKLSNENYFICMLFSVDNNEQFEEKHSLEDLEYFKFILLKVCEEIVGEYIYGSGIILRGGKICIIATADSDIILYENINSIYTNAKKEIGGFKDISVSISVGKTYRGIKNVRASYIEAEEALKYRLIFGNENPIYFTAIENRGCEYYSPTIIIKHIKNFLLADSFQNIEKEIDRLFDEIKSNNDISYDNIMQVLYQLIVDIVHYTTTNKLKPAKIFKGEDMLFKYLDKLENIDDVKKWILKIYKDIISSKQDEADTDKGYCSEIISIINENYMKSELDINFAASCVNLSYSHFRKIFKENIDDSFVDYVNNIRVKEAKKLLEGSDLTVEKIAEKVGFNNYQTFSRVFKKVEGITPGSCREINKNT